MSEFIEASQIVHMLSVAMVWSHGLKKELKIFWVEGRNTIQKVMQQHHNSET